MWAIRDRTLELPQWWLHSMRGLWEGTTLVSHWVVWNQEQPTGSECGLQMGDQSVMKQRRWPWKQWKVVHMYVAISCTFHTQPCRYVILTPSFKIFTPKWSSLPMPKLAYSHPFSLYVPPPPWHECLAWLDARNCLANHWNCYPEPASFTVNSVKQVGGRWLHPIELRTSDRLPSHPKQKMVEPQTAASPMLGLISVAYW